VLYLCVYDADFYSSYSCEGMYLMVFISFFQDYMIVFEEEVLPTADFLQFMAQCLDVIMKDSSLIGVSAWNDNGQCHID